MKSWIDDEIAGCVFKDARLGKRFRSLAERLAGGIGDSLPLACQDWAATKAAYRFLSNDGVDEDVILGGHFQSTKSRFLATDGPILVLQDTTEFSYQRKRPDLIGSTKKVTSVRKPDGRLKSHKVCGILMHSSLAVTADGLPLGLSAIKFWTRKRFKGSRALKNKINATRVPIEKKESVRWLENLKASTALFDEPNRCVHIGDRESDIYELFCMARELKTNFLVRACVDRLAGAGGHTISAEMKKVKRAGLHSVQVRNKKGEMINAQIEVKYRRIKVLPPIGKQKNYPPLILTFIHAQERTEPTDRDKIDWKLITNLVVDTNQSAIEKLNWYALRWKIEVFHKIMKSGCKAEDSKLRTADRLVNLISIFCLLSWRIFWMTMMNRCAESLPAQTALTKGEVKILDQLVKDKPKPVIGKKTLSYYLNKIARLGGYLNRAHDPPPGNMVMWRGLSRLTDIELGFELGVKLVGN